MPSAQDFQAGPPQFHPEFGYFCPSPQSRRVLAVAVIAGLCGAALGAVGITTLMLRQGAEAASSNAGAAMVASAPAPGADTTIGQTADTTAGQTTEAATPAATVATAGPKPAAASEVPCAQQTWPFLSHRCLAGQQRRWRHVRVVSVPAAQQDTAAAPPVAVAAVAPTVSNEVTPPDVPTATTSPSKREKTARTRDRRRSKSRRELDARTAFAAPYSSRYESRDDRSDSYSNRVDSRRDRDDSGRRYDYRARLPRETWGGGWTSW